MLSGAALALVAAACGGTSREDELTANLASRLAVDPTLADYDLSVLEAECTAETLLDDFGVDRLDALVIVGDDPRGLRYDELDAGDIDTVAGALASCIDASDGDSVADVLSEAVAGGVKESATDQFPVTDDEAACIGDAVVDDLGATTLLAVGIASTGSSVDLEAEQSEAFIAAFLECTDVRARVLDGVGGGDVEPLVLACLDGNITDEQVSELFALGFAEDPGTDARVAEVLQPAIDACT